MNKSRIQAIKAKIKPKIDSGDFMMLASLLDIPPATARQRYRRGDFQAVNIVSKLVYRKELMLNKLKTELKLEKAKNKKGAIGVAPKVNN